MSYLASLCSYVLLHAALLVHFTSLVGLTFGIVSNVGFRTLSTAGFSRTL